MDEQTIYLSNKLTSKFQVSNFYDTLDFLNGSLNYFQMDKCHFYSQESYVNMTFIHSTIVESQNQSELDQVIDMLHKNHIHKILIKYVEIFSAEKKNISFECTRNMASMSAYEHYSRTNLAERKLFIPLLAFQSIVKLLHLRQIYQTLFSENKFLHALMNLIEDAEFSQQLNENYPRHLMAIIQTLYEVSKSAKSFKNIWTGLKCEEILTEFAHNFRQFEPFSHMILSYVEIPKPCHNDGVKNDLQSLNLNQNILKDMRLKHKLNLEEENYSIGNKADNLFKFCICPSVNDGNQDASNGKTTIRKHVFMSYHRQTSPKLVKKIRSRLEAAGLNVWFDEQDMGLRLLSSMAEGIESTEVFLMCTSENYPNSIYCEAEAIYAFNLRKPIVTLMLTKAAKQMNGCVKFIQKDHRFIDFTDQDNFENSFNELKQALDNELNQSSDLFVKQFNRLGVNYDRLRAGSEQLTPWIDLQKWINENNLSRFFTGCENIDREMLQMLNNVRDSCFKIFFEHLVSDRLADLIDLCKFATSLGQLFKKSE